MTFGILRQETLRSRMKSSAGQRGAPSGRTAGGWVSDLAALGKAIVLCDSCVRRWRPRRYGYRARDLFPGQHFVMGECDGCGEWCQGTLHLKDERSP